MRPALYMMIGIPGSGKSTYAATMAAVLNVSIHSSDSIREELGLDPVDKKDNKKTFDELHKRIINDLKNGMSAIYDATNISRKNRMAFLKKIEGLWVEKTAFLFATPVDICIDRDSKRDRSVGEDVINRMVSRFQTPWVYEGWDKIVFVPNDEPFTYPTTDMDQKNYHHNLTLNDHQSAAEEYAYEHGFGRIIQNAALHHDIGKRFTQSIDEHGVAHYFNHHNAGAYYYLSGFSQITDDDLYIANLINWHMAPYMEWHQSADRMNKDKEMMGERMFDDIWKLHECDVAAH